MVGGADDKLRMSKKKKRLEGVTQAMVDRCVMEEVRSFLVGVLSSPPANLALFSLESARQLLGLSPGILGLRNTQVWPLTQFFSVSFFVKTH